MRVDLELATKKRFNAKFRFVRHAVNDDTFSFAGIRSTVSCAQLSLAATSSCRLLARRAALKQTEQHRANIAASVCSVRQ